MSEQKLRIDMVYFSNDYADNFSGNIRCYTTGDSRDEVKFKLDDQALAAIFQIAAECIERQREVVKEQASLPVHTPLLAAPEAEYEEVEFAD